MIHIGPAPSGAAHRKTHLWPATAAWSAMAASWGWWFALLLWWVGWFVAQHHQGGASWHFFADGARVLSDLDDGGHAGLHVYAEHPVLQIGPVALGTAWALGKLSDSNGVVAAQILGATLGGVVVFLVRHISHQLQALHPAVQRHNLDRKLLVAAACFVPVWSYVAVGSTHLDDVLALTLGVAALALVLSRHPVFAGLAVALAVDSKPWALPLAAVLLALPSLRDRVVAVEVAALGVAVVWLPFFIADPQTVRAVHFTIANGPLSGLRVLDVMSPRTPPWDRPLQTLLGAGLALAAVLRGRATGVLLVVMASRLALDPSTNRYYTAGLAAGALLWDVTSSRRRWPWWSLTVLLVLHGARWVPALNPVHGPALLAFALAATVFVLWGRAERGTGLLVQRPLSRSMTRSSHDNARNRHTPHHAQQSPRGHGVLLDHQDPVHHRRREFRGLRQ